MLKIQKFEVLKKKAFFNSSIESINIPPHVTQISKETFSYCKQLKTIEFPSNSALRKIEKDAFLRSRIQSIMIPQNLVELEEGWCDGTRYLNNIIITQNNPYYSLYEDNFIVTKSSSEKENFDVLVFCRRNVETVVIPDFVEVIGPYAFNECKKLQQVEFTENSNIRIIDKFAFEGSSIQNSSKSCKNRRICIYHLL